MVRRVDLNAIVAQVDRDLPGVAAVEASSFGGQLAAEADGLEGVASPGYVTALRGQARGMWREARVLRVRIHPKRPDPSGSIGSSRVAGFA